jgi:hypothetical protein
LTSVERFISTIDVANSPMPSSTTSGTGPPAGAVGGLVDGAEHRHGRRGSLGGPVHATASCTGDRRSPM